MIKRSLKNNKIEDMKEDKKYDDEKSKNQNFLSSKGNKLNINYKNNNILNMANELKKDKVNIDVKKLESMLGIKVFLINAQNKTDTQNVFDYILNISVFLDFGPFSFQ
mgnify:CR=1 FL=1